MKEKTPKIAIIGAGVAGLTAAHFLKKKGFNNLTVFEKEDRVGGKVFSYWHNGKPYELGALWIGNRYDTIEALVKEFKTPVFTAEVPDTYYKKQVITHQKFIYKHYGIYKFTKSFINALLIIRNLIERPRAGLTSLSPELFMAMKSFKKKYKIEAFADVLAPFVTGCGYGYYEKVPAIYPMKLLSKCIKGTLYAACYLPVPMKSFHKGWQDLWEEIAGTIDDVRLNAPVSKLEVLEKGDKTQIAITSKNKKEIFDKVIVTAPLDTLSSFWKVPEKNQKLFSKIKNYRYLVTLVEGKNLFNAIFREHITADTIGRLIVVFRPYKGENIFTLYQLLPPKMTLDQAMKYLHKDVQKAGGEITRVIHQREWIYFPHVGKEEFQNKFFEKLENLQGENNVFYAGGVMNFETVETTAIYSKELIERFFL